MPPSLLETFFDKLTNFGLEYYRRYYGFYRGTCKDVEDPEEQGRILVRVPIVTRNKTHPVWAFPIAPWAGRDSGSFIVPDEGDPVWVVFENGDPKVPMYLGGWWPKIDGSDNYAEGLGAYTNKKPTKRIFKTKAGHELSFEDDPENLSCKLVWHDPNGDKYSFFAFTKDGNIQMANHKGCFIELRAVDGEELVMIMDKTGNLLALDKDGIKAADQTGNVISTSSGGVQVLSPKQFTVNAPGANMQTKQMTLGSTPSAAIQSAVKGTSWFQWWTTTMITWLNSHTHPTGVGPSGQPITPAAPPVEADVLTDTLKLE